MIEEIRYQTMLDLGEKARECEKWLHRLCPQQQKRLQKALDIGCTWNVGEAGNGVFQVSSDPVTYVDINKRTCICGVWQHRGFPCEHAAIVLHFSSKLTGNSIHKDTVV